MKILFLHGWHSIPGGVKPSYLKQAGHDVCNPALDDDDFDLAVQTAQAEYDQHLPDVIVGSSRGSAVAMNLDSGDTPLVLLCPAWKNWGNATKLKTNAVVLHSRADEVIPFSDSEELVARSGLPPETLVEVGQDHRLADPKPLKAMLQACERLVCEGRLLVVRVMVAADSAEAAVPSAEVIRRIVKALGTLIDQKIEQYWKMPELFEVYFQMRPISTASDCFNSVLDSLGGGWDRHVIDDNQAWAVWTPEMGTFCLADARWANVEYFPSSSLVDEKSGSSR